MSRMPTRRTPFTIAAACVLRPLPPHLPAPAPLPPLLLHQPAPVSWVTMMGRILVSTVFRRPVRSQLRLTFLLGYYADAASATYSGCLARCDANSACLSFGLTSAPACILYNYTVEGNDLAYASAGNTFYDRGGACPTTTTSTVTSTSSTATPTQTGAFANVSTAQILSVPPVTRQGRLLTGMV